MGGRVSVAATGEHAYAEELKRERLYVPNCDGSMLRGVERRGDGVESRRRRSRNEGGVDRRFSYRSSSEGSSDGLCGCRCCC